MTRVASKGCGFKYIFISYGEGWLVRIGDEEGKEWWEEGEVTMRGKNQPGSQRWSFLFFVVAGFFFYRRSDVVGRKGICVLTPLLTRISNKTVIY